MIPVNKEFIEHIAMSIAKERLHRETISLIENVAGANIEELNDMIEKSVDTVFETMWNGKEIGDETNRQIFRSDALAAIRAINLKLMMEDPDEG